MKFSLFFIMLCLCISCVSVEKKKTPPPVNELAKMMATDREFSDLSKAKGMKYAFMEYLDSNGILLRPNEMPIVGADAIDYLSLMNDTTYSLTWEPRGGQVAKSGDLGFTYGIYTLKPSGKEKLTKGTYISVWKRQEDGNWKFVLDSGNEGIKE